MCPHVDVFAGRLKRHRCVHSPRRALRAAGRSMRDGTTFRVLSPSDKGRTQRYGYLHFSQNVVLLNNVYICTRCTGVYPFPRSRVRNIFRMPTKNLSAIRKSLSTNVLPLNNSYHFNIVSFRRIERVITLNSKITRKMLFRLLK